jgi:hypothetical protein
VTANPVTDLLSAPLSPDWTIDGLAEQLLGIISAQPGKEFDLNALEITDRQALRLIRPLLACLPTMSAAESGTSDSIYGGDLSFKRNGPNGSVKITGQFKNMQGEVRISLKRSATPQGSQNSKSESPDNGYAENVPAVKKQCYEMLTVRLNANLYSTRLGLILTRRVSEG